MNKRIYSQSSPALDTPRHGTRHVDDCFNDAHEPLVTDATRAHERKERQPAAPSWRNAVRRNIEEIHTPFGSQPVGWKAAQIYAVY